MTITHFPGSTKREGGHDIVITGRGGSMSRSVRTVGLAVLSWCFLAGADVGLAESLKTNGSNGMTVEDLGHGVKSAVQNVEKEIPKIGSAIGNTFKKVTDKESAKQPAQTPVKKK